MPNIIIFVLPCLFIENLRRIYLKTDFSPWYLLLLILLEMVSKLDDSVGHIVNSLGNRGMLRNSLILFLTDNGAAPIGKFRNFGSNYPLRGVSIFKSHIDIDITNWRKSSIFATNFQQR